MFAVDLACRLSSARPVLLALEIPKQEQSRIEAFLKSSGSERDRASLLSGPFWQREYQDGRSSVARLAVLDAVRALAQKRAPIRVTAIDDEAGDPKRRDEAMANELLSARRPGEVAIALLGNFHVRTRPGAPWTPRSSGPASSCAKESLR